MEKILIVEDEPIIAEDLKMIITKEGYKVAGMANDGLTALDILNNREIDLVLLDIAIEGSMSGIDVANVINEKYQLPFLYISSFSDKFTLSRVKETMPCGYIVKPFKRKDILANIEIALFRKKPAKVETNIKSIAQLNEEVTKPLSQKEYDILQDIALGLSNSELAEKHFISINTVKTHVKRLFTKMDVHSRSQAIAQYFQK